MQSAARSGIQSYDVKDPGGVIEIPDENAVLWRYMELAKLLALLSKRSLFFPSIDKLGDRFEGRWSERTLELIREQDELWTHDRGDHVVIKDRKSNQRLEIPKQEPNWTTAVPRKLA